MAPAGGAGTAPPSLPSRARGGRRPRPAGSAPWRRGTALRPPEQRRRRPCGHSGAGQWPPHRPGHRPGPRPAPAHHALVCAGKKGLSGQSLLSAPHYIDLESSEAHAFLLEVQEFYDVIFHVADCVFCCGSTNYFQIGALFL